MNHWHRYLKATLLCLAMAALPAQLVFAHLMEAQHGTLNIVDDSVFMVLSLPISAFEGLDDDRDGQVSMVEFNRHRGAIIEAFRNNIYLDDSRERLLLRGTLLSPVLSHDRSDGQISQLTVMGRFALAGADSALRFHVGLFGKSEEEQSLEITATRARDQYTAVLQLTPATPALDI